MIWEEQFEVACFVGIFLGIVPSAFVMHFVFLCVGKGVINVNPLKLMMNDCWVQLRKMVDIFVD